MFKISKLHFAVLFFCLLMNCNQALALTCEDKAPQVAYMMIITSKIDKFVDASEKLNNIKLSEIDSYADLSKYLNNAKVIAPFGDEEYAFGPAFGYHDFKSVCQNSEASLNKYFVIKFVGIEYDDFINNRESELYLPKQEAISKIKLGLSNETVLFKFKGYKDALNYVSKAAARIINAKDEIIASIENKAKEQKEEAAKKSKELNELKIKVGLEKERQRELARIEAEKNALLKELQETRNSTSQNRGSSSQSTASNNSARGDGYLKKGGVFCTSEASFDRQVESLARAQNEYSKGCYSIKQNEQAWLKDSRLFSGTCVIELVESRQVIWAFCEDYESN